MTPTTFVTPLGASCGGASLRHAKHLASHSFVDFPTRRSASLGVAPRHCSTHRPGHSFVSFHSAAICIDTQLTAPKRIAPAIRKTFYQRRVRLRPAPYRIAQLVSAPAIRLSITAAALRHATLRSATRRKAPANQFSHRGSTRRVAACRIAAQSAGQTISRRLDTQRTAPLRVASHSNSPLKDSTNGR